MQVVNSAMPNNTVLIKSTSFEAGHVPNTKDNHVLALTVQ